jgi:hypothetical protein
MLKPLGSRTMTSLLTASTRPLDHGDIVSVSAMTETFIKGTRPPGDRRKDCSHRR